jgi:hypothetical protein
VSCVGCSKRVTECVWQWGEAALDAGNFQSGRDLLLEVLREKPKDPNVLFQLACAEALLRRRTEACARLREALACGFTNLHALRDDPRLACVHDAVDDVVRPLRSDAAYILTCVRIIVMTLRVTVVALCVQFDTRPNQWR